MRDPARNVNEIERAFANDLIGDVHVPASSELGFWRNLQRLHCLHFPLHFRIDNYLLHRTASCRGCRSWQRPILRHIVRASASPARKCHSGSEFGEVAEWLKAEL